VGVAVVGGKFGLGLAAVDIPEKETLISCWASLKFSLQAKRVGDPIIFNSHHLKLPCPQMNLT
jgi:hypothetical protein